ncbi:MAG: hypothetical protein A2293_07240 [Elusimicrobia bacterium RIFOXYB2_FULL_49_7]|nr:MAG: hypothetical protein A2293_07240 [Elusimicrobia bacterium RIFOXYB2_FULL_49_7]
MQDKLFGVFSRIMGIAPEKVTLQTSTDNLEGWDSLKHLNLVMALEEAFSVRFSEEDIVQMLSIGQIMKKLAEKNGK